MRTRLALAALLLLGATLAAVEIAGLGGAPRLRRVTVPAGAHVRSLGTPLATAGAIRSAWLFGLWARVSGVADVPVAAGRHLVTRPSSYAALARGLTRGDRRLVRFVVPEGWVIAQIAQLAQDSLGIPAESLRAVTREDGVRARAGTPAADVEGYLFPATYEFLARGTTAQAVVDSMLTTFERRWKPAWDSVLARDGRSRHALVTLASIVEREAAKPAERPLIAAVYSNRLRDGERLQADPTVLYALGVVARRVLYADLRVDSPYNTYRNAGLPPGPIGAPGTASLAAAVAPAPVPYKFFVAFPDGHHEFRATYAEHLRAVDSARSLRRDATAAR